MRNKLFLFFLLFSISYSVFAQNHKIDSLKNILQKTNSDSVRIDVLNSISGLFWDKNWDSAQYYTQKSYDIAYKNKDKRGMMLNLINLAIYRDINGDFETSLKYFKQAERIIPHLKDDKLTGNYYYNLGTLYLNFGKNDLAVNNLKLAIKYYRKINLLSSIANINSNIAVVYSKTNHFQQSNKIYFDNLNYFDSIKDYKGLSLTNINIGINYTHLKQFEKAFSYFNKSKIYAKKSNNQQLEALAILNIGATYGELGKFSIAKDNLINARDIYNSISDEIAVEHVNLNLAEILIREKKYQEADELINEIFEHKDILNYEKDIINLSKMKGKTLFYLNNFKTANSYLLSAYDNSKKKNNNLLLAEILPYLILNKLKMEEDSVGENYFREYDSINKLNNEFDNKNSLFELDQKYQTTQKEAKITQQQLEIEKETNRRNIAIGSGIFILFLSGGIFYWFRNKQKQKELKTQNVLLSLEQNLNQMELAQLNQQLDPHEIKNLLASISPEIQEKAPDSYRKMLKLFNITKASLNGSLTESTETQIKQVEDYLTLAQSTMSEPLEFEIQNHLKNEEQRIPRLILKNLVENSVKHGIKGNEAGGRIIIELIENNGFLNVSVDDTGTGRKQAISLDSGIGTSTYQKLFETLNLSNKEKASFDIIDKEQGTRVEVKIPVCYKYE